MTDAEVEKALRNRLRVDQAVPGRLKSRESSNLEFKENFNWGSRDKYGKTMAAFANTEGGFIVFGVRDRPHDIVGVDISAFDRLDPARASTYLNQTFSPELDWKAFRLEIAGKQLGVIAVARSEDVPVVCRVSNKVLRAGAIYYRYHGQTSEIRYPELQKILRERELREREAWLQHLSKIARIGVTRVGVLDLTTGELSGTRNAVILPEDLLDKISFIREGHFSESPGARPALRIIGDVQVVAPHSIAPERKVRTPTVIGEPEIMLGFLRRQNVEAPRQYIRAACREPVSYLPFFYYAHLARLTLDQLRQLVRRERAGKRGKKSILDRLSGRKRLTPIGALGGTPSGKERLEILEAVRRRDLEAIGYADRNRLFEALTHCATDELTPELLHLLADIIDNEFESFGSNVKTSCRKAVAHLDEMLFRDKLGVGSD